jgi:hypothetical protein
MFYHPRRWLIFRNPNVIASDEGFYVEMVGWAGLKYSSLGNTILVNSEFSVSDYKKIMVVFSDIKKWDSGTPIDEQARKKIEDNITKALIWNGLEVVPQ